MKLEVLRFSSQEDCTNGLLFDTTEEVKFLCYTLEDERREDKVMKETRVPAGRYKIALRDEGGMTKRYAAKYGDMHHGMLCIHNRDNWVIEADNMKFQYILLHCGNTDEHTAGCLLVGDSQESNLINKDGFIGRSTNAYKRIYPYIVKALLDGEEVIIEYKDLD
tara:strand:+ start:323 stop:814 length:492 start_codon:yes stop_codon:yes gene_type:complete